MRLALPWYPQISLAHLLDSHQRIFLKYPGRGVLCSLSWTGFYKTYLFPKEKKEQWCLQNWAGHIWTPSKNLSPQWMEPHSRLDTTESSISELKDHPEEIAQDTAQRAKEMKSKRQVLKDWKDHKTLNRIPGDRRENGRESKWHIPFC